MISVSIPKCSPAPWSTSSNAELSTTAGSRFKRGLELSKEFFRKKAKGGITVEQTGYLYNRAVSISIYEAIYNSYEYGFRQGYNIAKKKGGKE